MPQSRATGKGLLLALLWALSLSALCILFTVPVAQGQATVSWARTLPGTGAWFIAAVALGLGYKALGTLKRGFARPRLWLLAFLLGGVATLGESFAQTGTTQLLTTNAILAAVYFAGRVPAYYMGMVLLTDALARPYLRTGSPYAQTGFSAPSAARPGMPANARPLRGGAETVTSQGQAGGNHAERLQGPPYPEQGALRPDVAQRASVGAMVDDRRKGSVVAHVTVDRPGMDSRRQPDSASAPAAQASVLPTWGFMLLLLLCWLPYLYATWPGTVSNDSITQIAEIFGRKPLSNGNPVFQTGLIWLAMSIGKGLFHSADVSVLIYACTQALLMAWLLGYSLRRMAETRAPRWLIGLATAFYALCPVFPVFAFCMGKDTSFAMAVLWLMLMTWRVVQSKWPPMRTVVGLCLSALLCALLRNAGVAVAAITLIALLIWAIVQGTRQWRAPLLALLLLTGAMSAMYLAVLPKLEVAPTPETENWSVPLQQVARVTASETLSAEESAAINAVMPVDQIQAAYNGELSDPIKDLWRDGVTVEQKSAFFGVWARLGLKHPATYLSATFHNSYGYILPGYVSTIKPTFLLGMQGRTTLIDGAFDFMVNPRANALKDTLQSLFQFAPFRLLTAPGAYGALTLFALAAILSMKKHSNALCVLPAVVTLVGCLFSAVNGYYRYAMPLYFAAPVMLALLAQAAHSGLRERREA